MPCRCPRCTAAAEAKRREQRPILVSQPAMPQPPARAREFWPPFTHPRPISQSGK